MGGSLVFSYARVVLSLVGMLGFLVCGDSLLCWLLVLVSCGSFGGSISG